MSNASDLRLSGHGVDALLTQVKRPSYERSQVLCGIVHLGLGAFHRAHQAVYTDAVLASGDLRWGILGVSLRDARVPKTLRTQDHLYSVTERHGEQADTRIVGALCGALHAPSHLQEVLAAIADPRVSIVTTTVTEMGYHQKSGNSDLDIDDLGVQHDLAAPDQPRTTLGVLAAGIRMRPASAPLTLVCCDNMAGNGDTLRKLLVQYAGQFDTGLASRIASDIALPNSMVDRIVPAATPASLEWAAERLGLRDEAAIVSEPFTQWVIEDHFAGPRPAWEVAGALITGDVRPYQEMKLRLLNGTHSAIAYAGQLCEVDSVSEALAHPLVGPFVRRLMLEDLRATVLAPRGYDVLGYCHELLRRFENPALAHRTQQIAMDGTQKVPVRWLPALRESLAQGIERPLLERALATWLYYLRSGRSDRGAELIIGDLGAPALVAALRGASTDADAVAAALAHTNVFGGEAWPAPFVCRLAAHLAMLRQHGLAALLGP